MARILAISSYVVHGHVGLAAVAPTLHAMGHEVLAVPTVVLSAHAGYPDIGGIWFERGQIRRIAEGLRANGWLRSIDAVMTGYLPSVDLVEDARSIVRMVREESVDALYLCDPVIGDDPRGLYVLDEVAVAVRDKLLPLADILTPNRYELEWLSGRPVRSGTDAEAAGSAMGAALLVATSVPAGRKHIANVFSSENSAGQAVVPREEDVPHGTGDLFAALLIGHLLNDVDHAEAVGRATAGVKMVIEAGPRRRELRLIESVARAVSANGEAIQPLGGAGI
ncbi:MAG: pyridoxal kinase [Hyphomicrobiaceae bacterium]|nr:pyridoxal kinase [Hyphomicrobiaceae bacterium]